MNSRTHCSRCHLPEVLIEEYSVGEGTHLCWGGCSDDDDAQKVNQAMKTIEEFPGDISPDWVDDILGYRNPPCTGNTSGNAKNPTTNGRMLSGLITVDVEITPLRETEEIPLQCNANEP